MSGGSKWCDICRGEDELFKCGGCTRRFHIECCGLSAPPGKSWRCSDCMNPVELSEEEQGRADAFAAAQRRLAELGKKQGLRKRALLQQHRRLLEPFVERKRLTSLQREVQKEAGQLATLLKEDQRKREEGEVSKACDSTQPSYITATLRDYQVDGVNWMANGFESGVCGILGDQMCARCPCRFAARTPPPTASASSTHHPSTHYAMLFAARMRCFPSPASSSLLRPCPLAPMVGASPRRGLGKTLQTLAFLAYLKKARRPRYPARPPLAVPGSHASTRQRAPPHYPDSSADDLARLARCPRPAADQGAQRALACRCTARRLPELGKRVQAGARRSCVAGTLDVGLPAPTAPGPLCSSPAPCAHGR